MSELDKISVDFGYAVGDLADAPEAKRQIKDIFIHLIGYNELAKVDSTLLERAAFEERNKLRSELKRAIEQL